MRFKKISLFFILTLSLFFISENYTQEKPVFLETRQDNILLLKASPKPLEKAILSVANPSEDIAKNNPNEDFHFIGPIPVTNIFTKLFILAKSLVVYESYQFSSIVFRYKCRVLLN